MHLSSFSSTNSFVRRPLELIARAEGKTPRRALASHTLGRVAPTLRTDARPRRRLCASPSRPTPPRRPRRASSRRAPRLGSPNLPERISRGRRAMSSSSSSWAFEHPNARGVLLPGQTKCHTGKLVPRVNRADPLADPFEPDQCPVPCSPCGAFPPPTPDHSDDEADDGGKENVSLASDEPKVKSGALPPESSRARLMGVAPCGSALKWSCCGACCRACTVWGEDGYALADADKHEGALRAAEYASWDGCTPIPEDVAAPAVPPRAVPGDRLGRIDVGRGAIACVAVARDGGAIAAGMMDGSFSVYAANPSRTTSLRRS